MMTIREYFEAQYAATQTDEEWGDVYEMEMTVFEMEGDEFEAWAEAHEIDLTATQVVLGSPILVVQLWSWDLED